MQRKIGSTEDIDVQSSQHIIGVVPMYYTEYDESVRFARALLEKCRLNMMTSPLETTVSASFELEK